VLQRIATVISGCVRATDIAARWGGEEFLVLMPDTTLEDARHIAERVMLEIRQQSGLADGTALSLTATLSVVTLQADETFRDALDRADQLLYQGKQEGRDRLMLAR
jgi:diguanylate cyclase (GGDEF)-like protein